MKKSAYCDRLTRRQAIKIGGTGLMAGLTLPNLLAMKALAPTARPAKAKACILLFLEGGPSTIDMWDLKPDAPEEIRGPYKPIATNVRGTYIGELMHRCAKVADKYTILRSHSHGDNGHQTGTHWFLTGYRPNFGDGQAKGIPTNPLYPSMGSVIARELGPGGPVPPYIIMPNPLSAGGPGFYGPSYSPFVIETDPVQPDFKVRDVNLASTAITAERFLRRRRMLERIEDLGAKGLLPTGGGHPPIMMPGGSGGNAAEMSTYYEKAFSMITSPQAREAFNIHAEPEALRERYGYHQLGQCSLLARRLVEAGCRFVGIDHGSWDTHADNFESLEKSLAPSADSAFAALVSDLDERGMLDETLVLMLGEMGRTPKINKDAGRDHWSGAQSVLIAGGGTKRGVVIGATDKTASVTTTTPVGIHDLWRTIFHLMGIDSDKIYYTPLGRPVPIIDGGQVFEELLA